MKITIRKYAQLIGTTHTTVSTAISKGFIKKGYDFEDKKIIKPLADKEWGLAFQLKKSNKKEEKTITQDILDDLCNVSVDEITLVAGDTYSEAERKKLIIQSQRELLKLKTESGELVHKNTMYKEMFEIGKDIRVNMQAIPDRIIDILITMNRNEAHMLLMSSINEVLTKLSASEGGN